MTEIENSIITDYQNGMTTRELCIKHNKKLNNRHYILKILKKYNINVRLDNETHALRYKVNENYFNQIDDQYKAYILGFIYADGNISKNTLRLQLAEQDLEILEHIKILMESTHPIKTIISKNPDHQNMVILDIHNRNIVTNLAKWGAIPAKTHKLTSIPNISNDLIHHFIRGYFDGDGCITSNLPKNKKSYKYVLSIVGTELFLLNVQQELINNVGLSKTKLSIRHKERNNNTRSLFYGGNGQIKRLFNYLYNNSQICLARKYNKFLGVFNQ